jgi:heterogeneous nuclear ribonucleoprotein A1/A3
VTVPRDRSSGQSKGIAFVSFSSLSGVLQAVGRDGDELLGRAVRVKRSDASAGSGPSGGGGSSGGGGYGGAKRATSQQQQQYGDRRG